MKLVSRQAWGARPPREINALAVGRIRGVAFHYSAADADEQSDHARCAGRVRGIQNYHMDTQGWFDIAYSHLVCKHGYVFAGRGYGIRTAANGTTEANSAYHAVCFLGDDTPGRDDLTDAGRQALVDIRREYLNRYPRAKENIGHRDVKSTSCPGDQIYSFVKSQAFNVAIAGPTRLPGPSPKPAEFWAWANWRLTSRRGRRPKLSKEFQEELAKGGWPWQALAKWQELHP